MLDIKSRWVGGALFGSRIRGPSAGIDDLVPLLIGVSKLRNSLTLTEIVGYVIDIDSDPDHDIDGEPLGDDEVVYEDGQKLSDLVRGNCRSDNSRRCRLHQTRTKSDAPTARWASTPWRASPRARR